MRNRKGKRPPRVFRMQNVSEAPWASPTMAFSNGPQHRSPAPGGFTMKDEARATASHQSSWGRDAKLRQKPVAFVSAGVIRPLDDLESQNQECNNKENLDGTAIAPVAALRNLSLNAQATDLSMGTDPASPSVKTKTASDVHVHVADEDHLPSSHGGIIDGQEKEKLCDDRDRFGNKAPGDDKEVLPTADGEQDVRDVPRSSLPADSNSTKPPADPGVQGNQEQKSKTDPTPGFFFDLVGDKNLGTTRHPPPTVPTPKAEVEGSDSGEDVVLFKGRKWLAAKQGRNKTPNGVPDKPSRNEPLQDAQISLGEIQHEIKVVEASIPPKAYVLGNASFKESKNGNLSLKTPRTRSRRKAQRKKSDDYLDDYIANMASDSEPVLGFNTFDGQRDLGGDSDAVELASLGSLHSTTRGQPNLENLDDDEDVTDASGIEKRDAAENEDGDQDLDEDEDEDEDDDEDMIADLDDESLARLLSKQEELGLGSDEILLYTDAFGKRENRKKPARHRRRLSPTRRELDAFDIMDLSQARLNASSKRQGAKNVPSFNLSDSELESTLQAAWQNDRDRKKERKQAREELRKQGLLGKHANPDHLSFKYPDGLTLDDVQKELRDFLLGSQEVLEFPPMDKQARKTLHELAIKFNVKSQSTGNGDQRRPVLYRTKGTVRYAANRGDEAMRHILVASARIHRKYFARVDKGGKGRGQLPKKDGGRAPRGLTYRDGEVVGASAPQIAAGNRGRTMLEKMGWSTGMALGTDDNKGILEPVAQIVKRSKAGLG